MIRIAQLGLVLAAAALWVASRMTWVDVTSFDGLGQPRTAALSGGSWSTALVPLAVLLLATAVAALAVRGWPLRVLAVLAAITSAGMAYLAISLWVIRDVGVRASHLADAPVADLVGDSAALRGCGDHGGGRGRSRSPVPSLLLRSATKERSGAARYARRTAVQTDEPDDAMSERQLWDALDEGMDPTQDRTNPDNKGR